MPVDEKSGTSMLLDLCKGLHLAFRFRFDRKIHLRAHRSTATLLPTEDGSVYRESR